MHHFHHYGNSGGGVFLAIIFWALIIWLLVRVFSRSNNYYSPANRSCPSRAERHAKLNALIDARIALHEAEEDSHVSVDLVKDAGAGTE